MASETDSVFSYDGEGESDSFSLSLLTAAVTEYFQTTCQLVKLAQGGFHKVRESSDLNSWQIYIMNLSAGLRRRAY